MEGQAFAISNIILGIVLLLWAAIMGLAIKPRTKGTATNR